MNYVGTVISYIFIAYGGLVVISNAYALFRNLKNIPENSITFFILGLFLIGIGFFIRSREVSDWSRYGASAIDFIRMHKGWLISALSISIGGILLLGLPGAALMEWVLDPVVEALVAGPLRWAKPHGDTVWPMALLYTVATPWLCFGLFLIIGKTSLSHVRPWNFVALSTLATALLFLSHIVFRFCNK
ncbi:hypothetical protein BVX98_05255 [bacterium F11]|nr:hypothetical protein BVX98_05255 [bacterium F11]